MSSHDLYPSLSGAVAAWRELEVVANNMANVSSTGFKQQRVAFELQDRGDEPLQSSYVQLNPGGADLREGPLQQTGVPTHIALRGQGFLLAEGAGGEEVLVRSGELRFDSQRYLVTAGGDRVLGRGGPIQVPEGEQIEIAANGTVATRRGDGTDRSVNEIDQLQLVTADELQPLGGSRWRAMGPVRPADDASVVQGALEGSNVDAIGGMLQLIEASRHFEMYQRAMKTSDELDGRIYNTTRG